MKKVTWAKFPVSSSHGPAPQLDSGNIFKERLWLLSYLCTL